MWRSHRKGDPGLWLTTSQLRTYSEKQMPRNLKYKNPGQIILKGGTGVGFTFILPYGKTNRHISCMFVHAEHQRQGLGKFMLYYAIQAVKNQGYKSITLGTKCEMVAFQMYRKYGFKILKDEKK